MPAERRYWEGGNGSSQVVRCECCTGPLAQVAGSDPPSRGEAGALLPACPGADCRHRPVRRSRNR
jgi:hypothetical protein